MNTYKYKGKDYELKTGKLGGLYFIDDSEKKHYVKGKKPKKYSDNVILCSPKLNTYYGYFTQYDKNGFIVDDFKEWCEAETVQEAREYFKQEYRHNPYICLDNVVRQN